MDDVSRVTELYLTGLKNAHAMESQALAIMRPQSSRIESYPEVKQALDRHIGETETQIDRLSRLLDAEGTDANMLKDAALSMAGGMAALTHSVAGDEILKNAMANYAFEHFEIAAYSSLLVLAEAAGRNAALGPLRLSLAEEQAMAAYIGDNLDMLTRKFASLSAAGVEAKK